MLTRARHHSLKSNRSVGSGLNAGLSTAANCVARDPSRLRNGRWHRAGPLARIFFPAFAGLQVGIDVQGAQKCSVVGSDYHGSRGWPRNAGTGGYQLFERNFHLQLFAAFNAMCQHHERIVAGEKKSMGNRRFQAIPVPVREMHSLEIRTHIASPCPETKPAGRIRAGNAAPSLDSTHHRQRGIHYV